MEVGRAGRGEGKKQRETNRPSSLAAPMHTDGSGCAPWLVGYQSTVIYCMGRYCKVALGLGSYIVEEVQNRLWA